MAGMSSGLVAFAHDMFIKEKAKQKNSKSWKRKTVSFGSKNILTLSVCPLEKSRCFKGILPSPPSLRWNHINRDLLVMYQPCATRLTNRRADECEGYAGASRWMRPKVNSAIDSRAPNGSPHAPMEPHCEECNCTNSSSPQYILCTQQSCTHHVHVAPV